MEATARCGSTNPRSPAPLTKRMVEAAQTAGIPFTRDYNSPEQDGVGWAQVTQRDGRRWSAADAYLRPALKRPNLDVESRAPTCSGLELSRRPAHGVRYRDKRGREQIAMAGLEVILSAGSICSPQILLLSGIGPEQELRDAGIEPKAVLPGVGREPARPRLLRRDLGGRERQPGRRREAEGVLEYLTRRSGPLSSSVAEALAFLRTKPGLPAADIELHLAPAYFNEHGADTFDDGHALTIGPTLLTPKSRGRVWLASSDPFAKPRILGNHLTEADDIAAMVAGMKRSRESRPRSLSPRSSAASSSRARRSALTTTRRSRPISATAPSSSITRSGPAGWDPTTRRSSTPS